MKEKSKTQSHYTFNIMVGGHIDSIDIIQEENEPRQAITVKFFQDRWRTPKDTVELLEKVIVIIKDNFK